MTHKSEFNLRYLIRLSFLILPLLSLTLYAKKIPPKTTKLVHCKCKNGIRYNRGQKSCDPHWSNKCASCKSGFELNLFSQCRRKKYFCKCKNGVRYGMDEKLCKKPNQRKCESCYPPFQLELGVCMVRQDLWSTDWGPYDYRKYQFQMKKTRLKSRKKNRVISRRLKSSDC